MLIFRKEKRDTSNRLYPVNTKSSLIWIKLQNLTSFSKGMGKKVVYPFIIRDLQKYVTLKLTAMGAGGEFMKIMGLGCIFLPALPCCA